MAPLLPLVLSLGLLLLLLPAGAQPTTIQELYVKPTEDTSCPEPCHTLDEYVQNATQYFVSSTAFNFLPGTHNLSQPLNVSGVTNLALVASNGTVNITCPYNSWLSFSEISNLTLEDLALTMCDTLFFSDILSLRLFKVSVSGYGTQTLWLLHASNIFGTSTIFGLRLTPYALVNSSLEVYGMLVQYTDPINQTFLLGSDNQLVIQDTSVVNVTSIGIQLDFSQSTYSVSVQAINITMLLVTIVIRSVYPNNISIMNSHFVNSAILVDENYPSETSTYIRNCQFRIQFVNNGTSFFVGPWLTFNMLSGEIIIEDSAIVSDNASPNMQPLMYITGSLYKRFIIRNFTISDVLLSGINELGILPIIHVQNTNRLTFIDCKFFKNQWFSNNLDITGSVILLENSLNITFIDCGFSDNEVTSIVSFASTFLFSGINAFSNNRAYKGGALAFYRNSYITLSNNSTTVFQNNSAEGVGGAIYVNTGINPLNSDWCAVQFLTTSYHCFNNSTIASFVDNSAKTGGSAIYGALFDTCTIGRHQCGGWKIIDTVFHFDRSNGSDLSVISSDPLRPCLCESGRLSCTTVFKNLSHYPGEPFQVSAVVVGDRFGTVYGSVYAQLLPLQSSAEVASIGDLEYSQQVRHQNCTDLTYTIYSNSNAVCIVLTAKSVIVQQYPNHDEIEDYILPAIDLYNRTGEVNVILQSLPVFINVTLLPCPLGFMLFNEPPRCTCDTLLQDNHISCNLSTQTVQRSGTVWVNASFHNYSSNGVIVNKYCPSDYCKPETVNVNLEHPDTQCAFSHSGILCGGCQSGLSLALGSAQCLPCSNDYLALLIPFALAGFALVLFIKVLNLTVADGTLNGLIFYANIVRANQGAWIPANDTNILTVFIAWLNLDLGIETCFFDGLDAYWKSWLQFVFPLYIWAIVVLIIVLSRYFSTAAKFFGSNSVPVLATLFLLSYPKLLRTIISILQTSTIDHPDGTTATMWSYDGNIPYLSPKHVPLFLVALAVILFLWLPYTGILSFTQCLHKMSNYRVARLLMKLKPFLDAYFGPLKDKHRYWVGLLLLVRGALFIVFAVTPTNLPEVDILITLAVVLGLVTYLAHVGRVYKKYYVSLLENSYLLNLGLLAGSTLYVRSPRGSQSSLAAACLGIGFTQIVVTVAVHFIVFLKGTWLVRKVCEKLKLCNPEAVDRSEYEGLANEPVVNRVRSQELVMSYGTSDYREPVLKYLDTET